MKSEIEGERVRRMKVRSGGWCLCVHTWCKGCVTGRLRHNFVEDAGPVVVSEAWESRRQPASLSCAPAASAPSLFNWLIKTLLEHWESCKMHGRNEQRHAVISYEIIECEWPMNTEPGASVRSLYPCILNSKAIQMRFKNVFIQT